MILICSTPLHGHVTPMLAAGRALRAAGHRVVVLTGSRFGPRVADAGLEFVALSGRADLDETDPSTFVPDQDDLRGLALSRYQLEQTFVDPLADQVRAVNAVLAEVPVDGILTDSMFAGIIPLLATPRQERPFVLGVGIGPLAQLSRDVAPPNSGVAPSSSRVGRARNLAMNAFVYPVMFRSTQRLARTRLDEVGGCRLDRFVLDLSRSFDRFLQLCPAEFEYPRSDLDPTVSFVGPFAPEPAQTSPAPPSWWSDLVSSRPIVHVTQGTLDTQDFGKLIRPTLAALAGEAVTVVASTGGRPTSTLGVLPPNAYAAEYLPYEELLPRTDVMVTNGGYGGTLHALRHGVPLVVAGAAEDKPEVAARVAHFGVGVDLRTGRPSPAGIRDAVRRVLADDAVHLRASDMREAIARTDAAAAIAAAVGNELATAPGPVRLRS